LCSCRSILGLDELHRRVQIDPADITETPLGIVRPGKLDLLLAIDNSSSMATKQTIFASAVPDLLASLLKAPRCLSAQGVPTGALADPTADSTTRYGCPAGSEPELAPITDIHIGIVSSSLGNSGGDVCAPSNARNNDRGHLLNMNAAGAPVASAQPSSFLSWFPQAKANLASPPPPNPLTNNDALTSAFQSLVTGVGQTGCGLEQQLESMYRFLIQPDPWDAIRLDGSNLADLGDGVDTDVLRQRADFLRPDSFVAVIMLTDEDDASVDPLSVGGQGWAFMAKEFPGSRVSRGNPKEGTTAPRGTSVCDVAPASDDCTSCGFASLCDGTTPACQKIRQDPNCKQSGLLGQSGAGYDGYLGPNDDALNVRFHRMKERYGIDPRYPLQRYIDGFTKAKIPDRTGEHVMKVTGAKRDIASYSGDPKCTNPLFAARLPRDESGLCALPRGTRTPDHVLFAVIGGVSQKLLYPNGYDASDSEKNRTTADSWTKILGQDSVHFNYDGIDPHMIPSVAARPGLQGATLPKGQNGDDPIHGREWDTGKSDLQFACTFALAPNASFTCTANDPSCDCAAGQVSNPPLCGPDATQVRAKAYPTVRELELVRALGDQGVAGSICPTQLTDPTRPDYGYRPAVGQITARIRDAMTTQCYPDKLSFDSAGHFPCVVLAVLGDPTETCERYGLQAATGTDLATWDSRRSDVELGSQAGAGAPVCLVRQAVPPPGATCKDQAESVWCYVETVPGQSSVIGGCAQAIALSSPVREIPGASFVMQCTTPPKGSKAQ
jgi:hypothetical protein